MKIDQKAMSFIHEMISGEPPETGGILGSSNGRVITAVIMDEPKAAWERCCAYIPNVAFLNQCIRNWQDAGIQFVGLFHTHFGNVRTLSAADIVYIQQIMNSVPKEISMLYFPIYILPYRSLVCYKAKRLHDDVMIEEEPVEMVD